MKQPLRIAALLLLALPLAAHDFWIAPSTYRPGKDALVEVALLVGDFGAGDPVERKDERIVKFAALTPDGERKIVGRDGALPAGFLRTKSDGIYVLGYQSNHAPVKLEPEKFAAYLEERGLDAIRKRREERGETGKVAREIYSRSPKSLLCVGPTTAAGGNRELGLALELVPEKNPCALAWRGEVKAFEPLPLRLAFQGAPLTGALVTAINLDAPPRDAADTASTVRGRTDPEGRVAFQLPKSGRWLVASVHMLALEGNPDADYESYWASLTFDV